MINNLANRIQLQYVPDIIGEPVIAAFGVIGINGFYDYGHYAEICKQLNIKDKGISEGVRTKYPLVWLVMDFAETFRNPDVYCNVDCQLIFACNTDKDYTMQQRRDITFKPVLYPILEEVLYQMSISRALKMPPIRTILDTKIDRPYWGGQESGNSEKNLFNDFIDAIQIKNLKLSISKKIIAC